MHKNWDPATLKTRTGEEPEKGRDLRHLSQSPAVGLFGEWESWAVKGLHKSGTKALDGGRSGTVQLYLNNEISGPITV